MTLETKDARFQVLALCDRLSRLGLIAGTGGNVAVRVDAARFAVTPSALDYRHMSVDDVCVLRLADLAPLEGTRAPSVESGLHARVLRARPEVGCSIHTHQPVASACALRGLPLAVDAAALAAQLGPNVPCVGYAPSGTGWLARNVGRAMRPGVNACLMARHGVLCVGRDATAALATVQALEALCARTLHAAIERRASLLPDGAAAALAALLPQDTVLAR